jgi:hypothetical protein
MLGKKLIPVKAHFNAAELADPGVDFKTLATTALQAFEK